MSNFEELMRRIENGDFKWLNINGYLEGEEDISFMLRPDDICFDDIHTILIETDKIIYKIRIPEDEDIKHESNWNSYEFTSRGIEYVFIF